ncbi:hypothetical protein GALMADRAFT_123687 [Galerina marginata CBS 339.88]|uniref:CHAT domain-containing protein n=1 Tax=Galerina marginata (strain CBS 339.88) TaxID=685588 RepID=A0A067T2S3_GALM3|nr:hypothetical protein GALMADRAFT_123687 [Galerina marginata CBS 339.88]
MDPNLQEASIQTIRVQPLKDVERPVDTASRGGQILWDIFVECIPRRNIEQATGLMITAPLTEKGSGMLRLERVGSTMWRYEPDIDLVPDRDELSLSVWNAEGDLMGELLLTGEVLKSFRDCPPVYDRFMRRLHPTKGGYDVKIFFAIGCANVIERLIDLGAQYHRSIASNPNPDIADITEAVAVYQKLADLVPKGDDMMPGVQFNLGNSLLRRFKCTQKDIMDISSAILSFREAARLRPNEPKFRNMLGLSLSLRFMHTEKFEDISEAILSYQKAIDLVPNPQHPGLPGIFNNLGTSLLSQFKYTGDLKDLSEGIGTFQTAVHRTPEDDPSLPGRLANLGHSLSTRLEQTGDLKDGSGAISTLEQAVLLTPENHPDLPRWFNLLAVAYLRRNHWRQSLADVTAALRTYDKAFPLIPEDHGDMSKFLNNYGNALLQCYEITEKRTYLDMALETFKVAASVTPDEHTAHRCVVLFNLGNIFLQRFQCDKIPEDLFEAMSIHEQVVESTPNGHAELTNRLTQLGTSYLHRSEITGSKSDLEKAISLYRQASTHATGGPSSRLESAKLWAMHSRKLQDPSESIAAYTTAIELLSRVAGVEKTIRMRHATLIDISDLSTTAAAFAISLGHTDRALEWLEQGRCIVWNQINNLRTPLEDLELHDARLASDVLRVSKALEHAGSRIELSTAGPEPTMDRKMSIQAEATEHIKLAQEWDKLLKTVRNIDIPKFRNFLRPPQCASLLGRLKDGPVVVINVHAERCDALALVPETCTVLHIPLDVFSHVQANIFRSDLYLHLSSLGLRDRSSLAKEEEEENTESNTRGMREEIATDMHGILQRLWIQVVKPILSGLNILDPLSVPSRIWWCPTGPLAFLPLHAAGVYPKDDGSKPDPGSCISDFAISSYVPTVTAFLKGSEVSSNSDNTHCRLLLISQPETPGLSRLPGTVRETVAIQKKMKEYDSIHCLSLTGESATTLRVMQEMESHSCVHLACHAVQDLSNPLKSGFCLNDGRLELSKIITKQIPHSDFAFLSACQTSSGDAKLSEEAVHLAAAMLAAGYQGVVATMWSIKDSYGQQVAEDFYSKLLSAHGKEKKVLLSSAGAASALHSAIQHLRQKIGYSRSALFSWVPYIHLGV